MVLSDKQKQFVELAMAEGYADTIDVKALKNCNKNTVILYRAMVAKI